MPAYSGRFDFALAGLECESQEKIRMIIMGLESKWSHLDQLIRGLQ